MKLPDGLIDEVRLPDREVSKFIRVLQAVKDASGALVFPSDGEEALRNYERMGILQACIDFVIKEVGQKVSEDFDRGVFPSQPSIHLEDLIHKFMKSEGFLKGDQSLYPDELNLVRDEVINQVESQGIAGFDYMDDDQAGTSMHFIRA